VQDAAASARARESRGGGEHRMSHGATLSHQRWGEIERPACSVLCTRRSVCTALQPTLSCISTRRARTRSSALVVTRMTYRTSDHFAILIIFVETSLWHGRRSRIAL